MFARLTPQDAAVAVCGALAPLAAAVLAAFDLTAFAILLYGFRSPEPVFQTAWFVLSLLTELAALMSLRTQGPAWRSRPGRFLIWISLGVGGLALSLPFTGALATAFGLTPLRAGLFGC